MPNLSAAKKDLRKSKKRAERNAVVHAKLRDYMRQSRKAAEKNDVAETEKNVQLGIKTLDKALQKGLLKKNTVARRKSVLARRLNAIKK